MLRGAYNTLNLAILALEALHIGLVFGTIIWLTSLSDTPKRYPEIHDYIHFWAMHDLWVAHLQHLTQMTMTGGIS